MIFKMNKTTRVLVLVMSTLVVLTLIGVSYYYKYENQSTDPRVFKAIEMYKGYNELAKSSNYQGVLLLMDSIENIYSNYSYYKESYEIGILYNNRAAAYLAMALLPQNLNEIKDSLLNLSKVNVLISIEIYSNWLSVWEHKNYEEIKINISAYFSPNDSAFHGKNVNRYLNKRTKGIVEAQLEIYRRLSVSHTNLGMVYRHKEQFDDAAKEYFKALEYWPDNLAAENNLNILLNQPLKKPSIIRTFFPKERLTQ
jgi:tetratricopeptide (TPR) repeat protein